MNFAESTLIHDLLIKELENSLKLLAHERNKKKEFDEDSAEYFDLCENIKALCEKYDLARRTLYDFEHVNWVD